MRPIAARSDGAEISDGFFAVDMDELSQQLILNSVDHPGASPPAVTKKNLSRKHSSSSPGTAGAERERNSKTTVEGDERHATGRPTGGENRSSSPSAVHVTVAVDEEAAAPDGGRWRRAGTRRSASPWLDPRRVVIAFATLSSMGTLILLYFTLSMGKMRENDSENNAW